jgi:hypothetical protein
MTYMKAPHKSGQIISCLAGLAILVVTRVAIAGDAWDGTWTLRPVGDGVRDILVMVVEGGSLSWWVPDEAAMHPGNEVSVTETQLEFDVGTAYGGTHIILRLTQPGSAVGWSERSDGSMLTEIAAQRAAANSLPKTNAN